MGNIAIQDAQKLYTNKLVAVLSDRVEAPMTLQSLFTPTQSWTKNITTQTERVAELIAKDVVRGTTGNSNVFGLSTEKLFTPPMYDEYFDVTQLDGYDQLYADPSALISDIVFGRFLQQSAEKLMLCQDKIERAYENQCASVLKNGIVTLNDGSTIDFKRKSASIVDLGSGNYWTNGSNNTSTADPNKALEAAALFLRTVGKSNAATYNVIMGSQVYAAYISNPAVLKRGAIFNWNMDRLTPALRKSSGFTDHGPVSAGSYNFNLISYPQYFDQYVNGSLVQGNEYLDPKSIYIVPEQTKMVLAYAAVPQLLSTGTAAPVASKFVFTNYPDLELMTHKFHVKSAGVAIPVAVDQIYTAKVIA